MYKDISCLWFVGFCYDKKTNIFCFSLVCNIFFSVYIILSILFSFGVFKCVFFVLILIDIYWVSWTYQFILLIIFGKFGTLFLQKCYFCPILCPLILENILYIFYYFTFSLRLLKQYFTVFLLSTPKFTGLICCLLTIYFVTIECAIKHMYWFFLFWLCFLHCISKYLVRFLSFLFSAEIYPSDFPQCPHFFQIC